MKWQTPCPADALHRPHAALRRPVPGILPGMFAGLL